MLPELKQRRVKLALRAGIAVTVVTVVELAVHLFTDLLALVPLAFLPTIGMWFLTLYLVSDDPDDWLRNTPMTMLRSVGVMLRGVPRWVGVLWACELVAAMVFAVASPGLAGDPIRVMSVLQSWVAFHAALTAVLVLWVFLRDSARGAAGEAPGRLAEEQ